jgi:hypothetical protein
MQGSDWGLIILGSLVLGFIGGWLGAVTEHFVIVHRMVSLESLARAAFAMNARKAQKDEKEALLQRPLRMIPQEMTDAEIRAKVMGRGE